MKIKRLYLENFKSYKKETINFDEGINCILGNNGAGKSTIIQAIGYAMFNCNIFTKKDKLIRYGETKAIIELDYVSNDGIIYTIVRTITSNSDKVKIIDQNTKEEIEDVNNVYPFIKKTLGIKQERNLDNLFREIIAVPQGEFVSLFLQTDSKRKSDFEELFNLKIYENIYHKSIELVSKNKDNKAASVSEAEGYKGETKDVESVRKEYEEINQKVKELKIEIKKLNNQKNELNDIIEKEEKISKEIEKLNKEISDLNVKKVEVDSQISTLKKEQEKIKEAEEIVGLNKSNYDNYLSNEKKIKTENEKIKNYNEDNDKINLEKEELSKILLVEKSSIKEIEKADMRIDGANIEITKIDKELQKAIKSKNESQKAVDELNNQLKKLDKELNDLLTKKDNISDKLNETKLDYKIVEKYENLDLNQEEQNRINLQTNLENKNKLVEKIEELNESVIKQRMAVENIVKNMEKLSNGECPILNTKCLTLSTNGNAELTTLLAKESAKINSLNADLDLNKKELEKYNNIDKLIIENNQNLNDIENYKNVVKEIKNDLKNNFKEIDFNCLDIKECFNLIQKIIDEINNEIIQKTLDKNKLENDIKNSREDFSEKNILVTKVQSDLLEKTRIIEEAVKEKDAANKSIKSVENSKKKHEEEISKLSIKIEENRTAFTQKEIFEKEQDKLKKSYELYIQYYPIYSNQESNLNLLNKAEESLTKITNDFNDKNNLLKEKQSQFDNKKFEENRTKFGEIVSAIKINNDTIIEDEKRLDSIKEKLEYKEKLLLKISELEKQIAKYEKVNTYLDNARQILKNLPIELSKQYRENIARMSTIYYQRISKENVTINIDDSYKVIVIDNIKKENTKDMTQLSGGEQMSLAISIRISMLKYFAGIDMYFLDEPTVNLDKERRGEIAEVIRDYSKELKQLFVISHDDTFESITTNILKLEKKDNKSELSIE